MSIKWLGSREWKAHCKDSDDPRQIADEDGTNLTIGVRKLLTPEIEVKADGDDEENRSLRFTISSNTIDRDGDKVKQTGWELDNYRKNPVVLWAHDSRSPPVARASDLEIKGNKKLVASAEFVPPDISPFADMVFRMYREKFLNATSVGFIPLEFDIVTDDENRGGFMPFDIHRQELLEFSAVPVPSNPDALVQARKSGIDTSPLREWAESALDQWKSVEHQMPFGYKEVEAAYRKASKGSPVSEQVGSITVPVHAQIGEAQFSPSSSEWSVGSTISGLSGVSTAGRSAKASASTQRKENTRVRLSGSITWHRAHPEGTAAAPVDEEWSGSYVRQNLTDDRQEWLRVFAWYDSNSPDEDGDGLPEDQSAWKLPHHQAGGDNPVVWKGVVACMASLMGAGGGVDVPDGEKRTIYNHLARHYREDFDETPPDFEAVENQVLASEEYTMSLQTGRPEKASAEGEATEKDETDLALEQGRSGEGEPNSAEAEETEDGTETEETQTEGGSQEAGPYEVRLSFNGNEVTCKVQTVEEMTALLEKFGVSQASTSEGESAGSGQSADNGQKGAAGGEDDNTENAAEQAVEELDLESLVEKHGEDAVLEMLPDIAEEVVDSLVDQAAGKVH